MNSVEELVRGVEKLVSLPDVFVRINQMVESQTSSAADIAGAINRDPAFTARLLRVSNSTFYGFPSKVDTVEKAVSIIGTSQIRNLALATSIASSFEGLPNTLVTPENFWMHSLYCALSARHLARAAGKCDADAVFTAGLLHDIGELVIFSRMPERARQVLMEVQDSGDTVPVFVLEQQVLGFDHARVGAELARQWGLPPLLSECIGFHHDISRAAHFPRECALIHIANILAQMAEIDTLNPEDVPEVDKLAWQITGLDAGAVVAETVRAVQAEFEESQTVFFGGGVKAGGMNGK